MAVSALITSLAAILGAVFSYLKSRKKLDHHSGSRLVQELMEDPDKVELIRRTGKLPAGEDFKRLEEKVLEIRVLVEGIKERQNANELQRLLQGLRQP